MMGMSCSLSFEGVKDVSTGVGQNWQNALVMFISLWCINVGSKYFFFLVRRFFNELKSKCLTKLHFATFSWLIGLNEFLSESVLWKSDSVQVGTWFSIAWVGLNNDKNKRDIEYDLRNNQTVTVGPWRKITITKCYWQERQHPNSQETQSKPLQLFHGLIFPSFLMNIPPSSTGAPCCMC